MSYLSLTAEDREAMLETIGVASIEELFADVPKNVRFGRELALEPALSELELVEHLTDLAERNVDTGGELSFLGAGIYDHYVPAVVDAVLSRGELLTAYTPYQPELSQGVLQAIFEYQTAICELTAMDVSNASGYDGTTVAADACFVAKHVTGRDKVVVCESVNPMVRQVVKTYAPGFGLEVIEVPHSEGVTEPGAVAARAAGAAAVIFQQPNFFGCLEPAPELAAAALEHDALPVAHVDPLSLGVLEAPGNYGCALAIGEGQGAGNHQSYGGPHYGFLAARGDYIRRMPGRIVGETTDVEGRRGFVLTLQTREQHSVGRRRRPTSPPTRRCWRWPGWVIELAGSAWAGGAGGDLHGARRVREATAAFPTCVSRTGNNQGVCHSGRTTGEGGRSRGARARRPPWLCARAGLPRPGRRLARSP